MPSALCVLVSPLHLNFVFLTISLFPIIYITFLFFVSIRWPSLFPDGGAASLVQGWDLLSQAWWQCVHGTTSEWYTHITHSNWHHLYRLLTLSSVTWILSYTLNVMSSFWMRKSESLHLHFVVTFIFNQKYYTYSPATVLGEVKLWYAQGNARVPWWRYLSQSMLGTRDLFLVWAAASQTVVYGWNTRNAMWTDTHSKLRVIKTLGLGWRHRPISLLWCMDTCHVALETTAVWTTTLKRIPRKLQSILKFVTDTLWYSYCLRVDLWFCRIYVLADWVWCHAFQRLLAETPWQLPATTRKRVSERDWEMV